MTETFYKVLGEGRTASQGTGSWPQARRWTPEVADPVLCESGWHLVTAEHLIGFLGYGPVVWTAEPHPDAVVVEGADKVVCSKARLLERTLWDDTRARLFAVDCAARVLHLVPEGEPRPAAAVAAARGFALGTVTYDERAAARDAAWAAAWAAAWDAAGAAARDAAGAAAWAAAWDAAGAAAWDAARAAAGDAERTWQTARLHEYLHVPDLEYLLLSAPDVEDPT